MVKLEGFYNDDTLKPMLHNGEITTLDYVCHQSEQMKQQYIDYCKERGLQQDEKSAHTFLEWSLNLEEKEHTDYLD
jgi:hypothetical protein